MRVLSPPRRSEHGFTTIEMAMAMLIMGIALSCFLPLLTSSTTAAARSQDQSEAVDQTTVALTQISRELRSAECITSPTENTTGTTLRFTTVSNDTEYEVIYRVAGGTLTRQVVGASQTTVVAEHLVSTSDAFTQISTPRRTVVLTFRVQVDSHESPRSLTTTLAGRNAWRTCPAPLG